MAHLSPYSGTRSALHKGAFLDALALKYRWQPLLASTDCSYGKAFTIDHALSCPKGGFPSLCHNEVRNLTTDFVSEICSNICTEPTLQPLSRDSLPGSSSSTKTGACLDITAYGFWGPRSECAYFDIRVFSPFAASNRLTSPTAAYRKHEQEKKWEYDLRVCNIEHVRVIHANSALPCWGSWMGGLCVLQAPCLFLARQVEQALLFHHIVDHTQP